MGMLGIPELVLIFLVVVAFGFLWVWPAMRICRRLGLSPILGLLTIFPILAVPVVWYVAYAHWPGAKQN